MNVSNAQSQKECIVAKQPTNIRHSRPKHCFGWPNCGVGPVTKRKYQKWLWQNVVVSLLLVCSSIFCLLYVSHHSDLSLNVVDIFLSFHFIFIVVVFTIISVLVVCMAIHLYILEWRASCPSYTWLKSFFPLTTPPESAVYFSISAAICFCITFRLQEHFDAGMWLWCLRSHVHCLCAANDIRCAQRTIVHRGVLSRQS